MYVHSLEYNRLDINMLVLAWGQILVDTMIGIWCKPVVNRVVGALKSMKENSAKRSEKHLTRHCPGLLIRHLQVFENFLLHFCNPFGRFTGSILFNEMSVDKLDESELAGNIAHAYLLTSQNESPQPKQLSSFLA